MVDSPAYLNTKEKEVIMTREIDFSAALSADDEQYIADRPWLLDEAERQGIEIVREGDEFLDGSETEDDESEEIEDLYGPLDYQELKDIAKGFGIETKGNKEQLLTRVREHAAALAASESDEDEDDEDDE